METLSAALPLIPPLETDWSLLRKMALRLRGLGYTEKGVSRAMGLVDHSVRDWSLWPAHLRNCRELARTEPLGRLVAFFFIEESIPKEELENLLGADVVDMLDRLFLIDVNDDGSYYFRFYLYPLLDQLILTDGHISNRNHLDQVYPLGSDSHSLARLAPRPKVGRSLDLCTGSGVHAVLAGAHVERAFGLDINPRALEFSRFNARWNGRDNVEFLESDCYQNVTAENLGIAECRFDLITANPPFVPTPEVIALCRGGGLSGEDVTERIIRGLPSMLAQNGIFSMITNVPHFRDQTFFQRCEQWLQGSGWGMVMLSTHRSSVSNYITGHLDPGRTGIDGANFQRWLESYESAGIVSMSNSQVYLFRHDYAWRIDRDIEYPNVSVTPFIEAWLATLRAAGPGKTASFRVHPGLAKVWWVEGRAQVFCEWDKDHHWWQPQGFWLEGSAARALETIQNSPAGVPGALVPWEGLSQLVTSHVVTVVQARAD